MSDSDGDYGGNGYSSEEGCGGGGYSSEEYCGGGGYSSGENYGEDGYSSEENHGGSGGNYSEENYGEGGYSSEENHGGCGCGSGGKYSEDNYGSGGGYSSEDIDPDEKYSGGGQTETDPDREDGCGYDYESEDAIPPPETASPNFWSYESKNTSKFRYEDCEDGKHYSAKFTDGYKAQDFVEKRTGNPVFKEEVNRKSYCKVDDKIRGLKTEYETQVKTTKKVTANINTTSISYPANAISSSFKRLNIN